MHTSVSVVSRNTDPIGRRKEEMRNVYNSPSTSSDQYFHITSSQVEEQHNRIQSPNIPKTNQVKSAQLGFRMTLIILQPIQQLSLSLSLCVSHSECSTTFIHPHRMAGSRNTWSLLGIFISSAWLQSNLDGVVQLDRGWASRSEILS
ncbi:hypothetical protein Dimus_034841 [Dionaea muscipula]